MFSYKTLTKFQVSKIEISSNLSSFQIEYNKHVKCKLVVTYPRSSAKDRRVYVWGLAETGALGIQRNLKKATSAHTSIVQHPSRLSFAETLDVVDVACGYGFSAFAVRRKDDISLFGTGINTDTQIGFHKHGGELNRPMEVLIYPAPIVLPKSPTNPNKKIQIRKCSAGRAHLLAISDDNIVYSMGNNAYGQCGRSIVQDELYAGREYIHTIENFSANDKIVDIHCGQDHSLFLTSDGKVYACGWGADGQTGLGHYRSVGELTRVMGDIATENIVKVAGTVDCVLALNGTFYQTVFLICFYRFSFSRRLDKGEVFGWGNAEYQQLETHNENQQICVPQHQVATKKMGKVIDIAAGGSYCLALNGNFLSPIMVRT